MRLVLLIVPALLMPAGCLAFGYGVGERLNWTAAFFGYGLMSVALDAVRDLSSDALPTVLADHTSGAVHYLRLRVRLSIASGRRRAAFDQRAEEHHCVLLHLRCSTMDQTFRLHQCPRHAGWHICGVGRRTELRSLEVRKDVASYEQQVEVDSRQAIESPCLCRIVTTLLYDDVDVEI